jgi:hypothetical protein
LVIAVHFTEPSLFVMSPNISMILESETTMNRTNNTPIERIKAGAKLLILAIIAIVYYSPVLNYKIVDKNIHIPLKKQCKSIRFPDFWK